MLNLEDYNKGLIYTGAEGCVECNKCIHECPVLKSNVSVPDADGKHKMCVDERECILCGTCIDTCTHDIRHFKDDCSEFFAALEQGKEISLIVAPSFYLNYPNEYKNILGYLRSRGVKNFYPVSFGADIATWGYLNFLENKTDGYIAQPCPTIVSHIEKHQPELLPNIIPVQSPMMCIAIYLKKYLNITGEIAFLSPCIAKKAEIESQRGLGLIQYNVTFKRLEEYFRKNNVYTENFPEIEEELSYGMGAIFPMIGGLKENMEYYLGSELMIMRIDGEHKSYQFLKSFADEKKTGKFMPTLVDIVNCENGCGQGTGTHCRDIDGNGISYQSLIFRNKMYNEVKKRNQLDPALRRAALNDSFKHLNLQDFLCAYERDKGVCTRTVPEAQIEAIMTKKLMKLTENDRHVDCSACGYDTCREMAEAVALGINHHDNCVYYVKNALLESMKEKSETSIERYAMINIMPIVISVLDRDLNLVECNEKALNLFELISLKEYQDNFLNFWPEYQPDGSHSLQKAKEWVEKAMAEGSVQFDWVHQNRDGEQFPTKITLMRLTWKGENHVLACIEDMRDFYKIQQYARLTEERLNVILNASPILCALYDKSYRPIDANQAAAALFGLADKREYIDNFNELVPEFQPCGTPSLQKVRYLLDETFEHGRSRFEWMHCTLDKKKMIPCEVFLARVTLGEKDLVLAFVRDIREQYQLKEMLKELEAANERERLANQAKTSFLARMSHEIRTPMNSILGITELQLQKDTHSAETEEAFSRVYGSSRMLLAIINDILDLSKVEAGKMEIIPSSYDSASFIVDTVQLNLLYIGSNRIAFNLRVDEELPKFLVGDELRVKQVLNNILSNAFKYTLEGEVCLELSTEKGATPDEVIFVASVTDTGQGMSKEQLDSLFTGEFTRFNIENNKGIEGSGLGLSIAHQLVKMMGGEINAESELGKGSIFTMRIPQQVYDDRKIGAETALSLQNLKETQNSIKRVSKLEREPMPYGRVLVVDDVESNLYVAKGFLMPYKITVETADSGILAIEKIKEGEVYDIIFMDHMMPDMDGIEATKIIREMGYYHPIVALTANAFSDMKDMFLGEGFSGYASKPIDFHQIDTYLLRFIRDKQPPKVIEMARKAKAESQAGRDRGFCKIIIAAFLRDADKAFKVFDTINFDENLNSDNLNAYITQIHAMRSALKNIGRTELSNTARILERTARMDNFDKLKNETPAFLQDLRNVVSELEPVGENDIDASEQDLDFLHKKMKIIADACELFEIDEANEAIENLRQKPYSKHTKAIIKQVSDLLQSGDFSEAGDLARQAEML